MVGATERQLCRLSRCVCRELKPGEVKMVTDLAAQEMASRSGGARQAAQRQAAVQRAAAAAASLPRALRQLDADVLERFQKARE